MLVTLVHLRQEFLCIDQEMINMFPKMSCHPKYVQKLPSFDPVVDTHEISSIN